MKTWQFDLDGNAHTLVFDAEKSPPVVTLDGKSVAITPKLTKNGQAYGFMLHKHTGTIQTMQTEKGVRYGLMIDGQPVTPRPQPKADVAPLTQLPKRDCGGYWDGKYPQNERDSSVCVYHYGDVILLVGVCHVGIAWYHQDR